MFHRVSQSAFQSILGFLLNLARALFVRRLVTPILSVVHSAGTVDQFVFVSRCSSVFLSLQRIAEVSDIDL